MPSYTVCLTGAARLGGGGHHPCLPSPGQAGFLFGGSTGTAVSGAMDWLAEHDARDLTGVAIAPDLGKRYLATIYQTNWLQDLYGEDVLSSGELPASSRPV